MNLSKQSQFQFTHLNTNMGITGTRDSFKKSLYGTSAFFTADTPNDIYSNGNIKEIVTPIIKTGGDVLGFSEVYGTKDLHLLKELLEKGGYNTYSTDAFEMWSQNIPGEHLYNVIGINKEIDPKNGPIVKTKLINQRKLEGVLISLKNIISSSKNLTDGRVGQAIALYKRLANGILDGAITSFEITPDFTFSHLHVHSDNPNLRKYFEPNIFPDKAHMMFGDFNIGDLDKFILTPPFSGIGYKTFLAPEDKNYSFAKGFNNLPLHSKPDNVIGNTRIENMKTCSIPSGSDHNTIISTMKVK